MKQNRVIQKLIGYIFITAIFFISILGGEEHQISASEESEQAKPTYVIGLDDTFAPMGFRNAEGEIVGFDIDLATEVAERNNWNIEFQPIDWSLKETELNSGNIDMIWNGYGITPEREEKVLFSEPYIESGQIVISKDGSGIDSLEDLEGKSIATQSGSTALEFMKSWPNDLFSKLGSEPVLYADYNQVFSDLDAGRVNAIYVGGVYGMYTMNQRGLDQYQFFTDETSVEPMGVGFRKNDTALKEEVDTALQDIKDDGTYDEIYNTWFGDTQSRGNEQNIILSIMPSLLDGLKLTIFLFVIVLIISIPVGFIIAILRVSGPSWIQWIIEAYVFVMRGTPLMLQLMIVFFGLPFIGITMDRLPAALFAFILNYSAYFTEIFRGGITSVPKGQFESISVLGIGKVRGFKRIILPQVIRIVMPSVGNEVVSLVKDTSLVYVIGLGELLRAGSIASNTYATLLPYLAVGVIYLILTGILTVGLKQIEKKMNW